MVHEQSACTHTSLAHAVARFQLALASELEGILKSQVSNHLTHNGGSSKCVSLVLQCHIWLWWAGYVSFTHTMPYIDCP